MAVVVVGSANVDLVVNSPDSAAGETLIGSRFEQLFGGKGANQARDALWGLRSASSCASTATTSAGGAKSFERLGIDANTS